MCFFINSLVGNLVITLTCAALPHMLYSGVSNAYK